MKIGFAWDFFVTQLRLNPIKIFGNNQILNFIDFFRPSISAKLHWNIEWVAGLQVSNRGIIMSQLEDLADFNDQENVKDAIPPIGNNLTLNPTIIFTQPVKPA